MSYMTISSQEKPLFRKEFFDNTYFFTLFIFSHASDNTTSQNIGGTDAWAVPHLKFLGGPSPSGPRSPPLTVAVLISWWNSPEAHWSDRTLHIIILLGLDGILFSSLVMTARSITRKLVESRRTFSIGSELNE